MLADATARGTCAVVGSLTGWPHETKPTMHASNTTRDFNFRPPISANVGIVWSWGCRRVVFSIVINPEVPNVRPRARHRSHAVDARGLRRGANRVQPQPAISTQHAVLESPRLSTEVPRGPRQYASTGRPPRCVHRPNRHSRLTCIATRRDVDMLSALRHPTVRVLVPNEEVASCADWGSGYERCCGNACTNGQAGNAVLHSVTVLRSVVYVNGPCRSSESAQGQTSDVSPARTCAA